MNKKGRQQILESLIELLLKNKIITPGELQRAIEEQASNGGRLESILVRVGYLEEEDLVSFLCNFYKIPFFRLSQIGIKPNVIKLIPSDYARKYLILPVHHYRSRLTLTMVDPSDRDVIDQMTFLTGFNIEPIGASETEILSAIKKYYGDKGDLAGERTVTFDPDDNPPGGEKVTLNPFILFC